MNTRPTSDKVKESIFNIIYNKVDSSIVLDLFSGTGNLGLECLSRGARNVTFIDVSPVCIKTIYENVNSMGFSERSTIIKGRVESKLGCLKGNKYDLIFIDPPYLKKLGIPVIEKISAYDILDERGLVVVEHSAREVFPQEVKDLIQWKNKKYGDTCITFYIKGGKNEDRSLSGEF